MTIFAHCVRFLANLHLVFVYPLTSSSSTLATTDKNAFSVCLNKSRETPPHDKTEREVSDFFFLFFLSFFFFFFSFFLSFFLFFSFFHFSFFLFFLSQLFLGISLGLRNVLFRRTDPHLMDKGDVSLYGKRSDSLLFYNEGHAF